MYLIIDVLIQIKTYSILIIDNNLQLYPMIVALPNLKTVITLILHIMIR